MSKYFACAAAFASVLLVHAAVHADEYDEAYKRVGAIKTISAYGPDIFGDKVNLYDGSLEFVQQDVSLPGNSGLDVAVGRRRTTGSPINVLTSQPAGMTGSFGDWELEIPHLHGRFSFGAGNKGWAPDDGSYARCTKFGMPAGGSGLGGSVYTDARGFWHGSFLYIPGKGDQEMVKRTSNNSAAPGGNPSAYPIVTHDGYQVKCGVNLVNGSGEGFLVTSPQGVIYRFDRIMSWYAPAYPVSGTALAKRNAGGRKNVSAPPSGNAGATGVATAEYWIVPSTVTDRFGNTVTYNWDATQPKKLNSIVASDGRKIDFTYDAIPNIKTVTVGTRVWTYGYTNGYLSSVTLPDNSAWNLSITPAQAIATFAAGSNCNVDGALSGANQTVTFTHPSGATGTFQLSATKHGRALVPSNCASAAGNSSFNYPLYPRYYPVMSLMSKSISGPGLGSLSWSYGYPTAVGSWSSCISDCGGTKTVSVTDSDGKIVKHTFGTVWSVNDGQLFTLEEGSAGGSLRTTNYTYAAATDGGGQPFPDGIGFSDAEGDHFRVEKLTPQRSKSIAQQAATFSWFANSYDSFARPASVTKSSTLNTAYTRTELLTYKDIPDIWVIGLPESVSVVEPSVTTQVSWNSYDMLGRLLTDYKFGFWQHIRTYNTDGTLATIADGTGDPHKIVLSSWKRGIPQSISYPTGHSKTAVVNDYGRITSLTDEGNATTGYDYDPMGRLKTITYPAGDAVAYNATNVTFAPITGSPPYGLVAGTWKQTLTTGNLLEENYFDALWRPIISHRKDTSTGKERFVVKTFDMDSHTLLESYPIDTLSTYGGTFLGTYTSYDALGRPYQVQQSSELGYYLNTYISYLDNFQTQTKNPRGKFTTVSYQAFDEPSADSPVKLVDEIGTTDIGRTVFGETTAITRSGPFSGGTRTATRSYVYDGYHRLCKRIDPESGATVMGYDAAGNVSWQAEGLSLPSTSSCDQGSVGATAMTTFGYDARNRLLTNTYGDGTTPGVSRTLTGDGLPATVAKGNTTWTYTYNNRRLLTNEVLGIAGVGNYPIKHEFNANGDETYLTYPDNTTRPALNPTAFGEQGTAGIHAINVVRHPTGAVKSYTFGNGITRLMGFNDRGLVSSITDTNPGAGVLYQDALTYDANANVATLTNYLATTDTTGGTHTRTMGYDALDRLTGASSPAEWGDATYGYDPLDNLLTRTRTGQNVWTGYGANNRINGFTVNGVAHTLGQDTRGNITQRGNVLFAWDAEDRMTSVGGPAPHAFEYDGNGRRVLIHNADSVLVQVYSQKGLLLAAQKINSSGAVVTTTKTYFLDSKPIIEINNGTGSWIHTDALGSVVLRTDTNRASTVATAYDPWGDNWAGAEPKTFGYTGHANDQDNDLVQMQQRYYDPLLGRFLSVDSKQVSTKDGRNFNRYSYANDNPYRYTDPDGREFKFAEGSSFQFARDIGQMRSYLSKSGADGPLRAIDASATTITLQQASTPNDMRFNSDSMTIFIDTRSGLEVGPGQVQSPALGLLHEAGHAARAIADPTGMAADKQVPAGAYSNKEEQRVVDKIETPAARALGEPTRSNDGGRAKQVECPTCSK